MLAALARGIDPNTGQPIADAPTERDAPSWWDGLATVDWNSAPRRVADIGDMIARNSAVGDALQRRIDDDARWAQFLRDLERYGHASSQAR